MNAVTYARVFGWLPIFLLFIVVAQHFFLVRTQHLSPWLGGGFGMFASTDVGSSRKIIVTAISKNGEENPITLAGHLEELYQRARGLPSARQLDELAQATWKELERESVEGKEFSLALLRIEVWKTHYNVKSLQPEMAQIVLKIFDFEHKKN
ncbi:MAG: hypothetical protein GQ583_12695 [Methyloprofundus sp.]|nr:hypothetical protein [Methyloprofundus sp.]